MIQATVVNGANLFFWHPHLDLIILNWVVGRWHAPPLVGAANCRRNRGPRCCGRRARVPSARKEACPFVLSFLFLRRVCQRPERFIRDGGFRAKDRLTLERFIRVELLPSEAQVTLAGLSRQYLLNG